MSPLFIIFILGSALAALVLRYNKVAAARTWCNQDLRDARGKVEVRDKEIQTLRADQKVLITRLSDLNKVNAFFSDIEAPSIEWTQEDVDEFRKFLRTNAGKKFIPFLQRREQAQNRYVVLNCPHEPAIVGTARGYRLLLTHILQLSADVRPQQDENNDTLSLRGEEELRESYTP